MTVSLFVSGYFFLLVVGNCLLLVVGYCLLFVVGYWLELLVVIVWTCWWLFFGIVGVRCLFFVIALLFVNVAWWLLQR